MVAVCVKDVFSRGTPWQSYMDQVNDVATYFNHHRKVAQMQVAHQLESGVSNDRPVRYKLDVLTRWHSRIAAMVTYMTHADLIQKVTGELNVSECDLSVFQPEKERMVAKFIVVLKEVCQVASALEAGRKMSTSKTPRYLCELCETVRIMARVGRARQRLSS